MPSTKVVTPRCHHKQYLSQIQAQLLSFFSSLTPISSDDSTCAASLPHSIKGSTNTGVSGDFDDRRQHPTQTHPFPPIDTPRSFLSPTATATPFWLLSFPASLIVEACRDSPPITMRRRPMAIAGRNWQGSGRESRSASQKRGRYAKASRRL